jgi:hypothetical protein
MTQKLKPPPKKKEKKEKKRPQSFSASEQLQQAQTNQLAPISPKGKPPGTYIVG